MAAPAQTFIDALHRLEDDRDVGPIAELFADGADVSNPLVKHDGEGQQGAEAFWTSYRDAFDTVRSEFRNIVDQDDLSILEWTSEGRMNGAEVRYGGVSILEHGDGGITAFRTYFDPTPLGRTVTAATAS